VSPLPREADAAEHESWSGGSSSSLKLPQGAAGNRRSLAALARNWPCPAQAETNACAG